MVEEAVCSGSQSAQLEPEPATCAASSLLSAPDRSERHGVSQPRSAAESTDPKASLLWLLAQGLLI